MKETIANSDIKLQLEFIIELLEEDPLIRSILECEVSKEINAYLGAGCINQRVWNRLTGRSLTYGIDDYDLIYFSEDTTFESQSDIQKQYDDIFPDLNIECTNQARVHIWYEDYFGEQIPPITSVEDAINFWPTTASAIGVYLLEDNLKLFAPRGLQDLLSMKLRANKGRITRKIFEDKAAKWTQKWPELEVIEWDD